MIILKMQFLQITPTLDDSDGIKFSNTIETMDGVKYDNFNPPRYVEADSA
jgi:hypothetical protein